MSKLNYKKKLLYMLLITYMTRITYNIELQLITLQKRVTRKQNWRAKANLSNTGNLNFYTENSPFLTVFFFFPSIHLSDFKSFFSYFYNFRKIENLLNQCLEIFFDWRCDDPDFIASSSYILFVYRGTVIDTAELDFKY